MKFNNKIIQLIGRRRMIRANDKNERKRNLFSFFIAYLFAENKKHEIIEKE